MEHLAEIIASFAGGAGVYAIIQRLTRNKSDNEELNDTAVRLLRDEIDALRQRNNLVEGYNAQHVKAIAELEKRNYELKMRNEILNAFPFHLPLPTWSVDFMHRYDYINEMYEKVFLRSKGLSIDDAMGKTLREVWPEEVAAQFIQNNQQVMDDDVIMNDIEKVPDATGRPVEWRILKVKRPYPLGVVGIAIPRNGMFDKMLRKIQK